MVRKVNPGRISMFLVITFALMVFGYSFPTSIQAQQEEYYEDYVDEPQIHEDEGYVDEPQIPEYDDPQEYGDDYINEPENPDPGFMDEVEPGEYNQSDDTTELNDNY